MSRSGSRRSLFGSRRSASKRCPSARCVTLKIDRLNIDIPIINTQHKHTVVGSTVDIPVSPEPHIYWVPSLGSLTFPLLCAYVQGTRYSNCKEVLSKKPGLSHRHFLIIFEINFSSTALGSVQWILWPCIDCYSVGP